MTKRNEEYARYLEGVATEQAKGVKITAMTKAEFKKRKHQLQKKLAKANFRASHPDTYHN